MTSSIFVSIASYRDSHIHDTVDHLFENAAHPERVFAGVYLQGGEAGPLARRSNVRVARTHYMNARGPLAARQWIIKNLYRGEDYYLQIDSHTSFVRGWDTKLIENLSMTSYPDRSIITCYPVAYDRLGIETRVPHMIETEPYQRHPVMHKNVAVLKPPGAKPTRTPYLAAGFLFGMASSLLSNYPHDDLPYLFQGEETLLAYNFGTFRFYAPKENIAGHLYGRFGEPKFWTDHPREVWVPLEKASIYKVLSRVSHRSLV